MAIGQQRRQRRQRLQFPKKSEPCYHTDANYDANNPANRRAALANNNLFMPRLRP